MIYKLGTKVPKISERGCFVAQSADLIGEVILEDNVSVWFNAVLRADNEPIHIGKRSNIQDGCVLHVDDGYPLVVGEEVTVGHKVMLHGCTIKDNALIGINAVVLNGAVIGKNALIGANALITENTIIPDNAMVLGSPGKVVKTIGPEVVAAIREGMLHYVEQAEDYAQRLESC